MSEHDPHEAEARGRWGDTEAYAESRRRTEGYSDSDWGRIRQELADIEQGLARAMEDGAPPDAERAMDLAEEARLHIDRWFYPCSREMHAGLADMYTSDKRFAAHYEERAAGLAAFVSAAIKANAERRGA